MQPQREYTPAQSMRSRQIDALADSLVTRLAITGVMDSLAELEADQATNNGWTLETATASGSHTESWLRHEGVTFTPSELQQA